MSSRARGSSMKGVDASSARGRRENQISIVRKEKRDENLMKRRTGSLREAAEEVAAPVDAWGVKVDTGDAPLTPAHHKFTEADFPQMLVGLKSADVEVAVTNLRGFRRLLSAEKNPPVQLCIDSGVIPLFVEMLQRHDSRELQFEAAWALTNIASTDRTRVVVECGAVPHLVNLLLNQDADVRDQSAWCLGNVAGDSAELRDVVLAQPNVVQSILQNLAQPANLPLMRNCTWTLSNFCRGKPQPPLSLLQPALPMLAHLLAKSNDPDTTVDACWALSYISDGDNDRIMAVVDQGVVPTLVNMLKTEKTLQIIPALRSIGNIVSGNDRCTQAVVDADFLCAAAMLLENPKKNIRKETCWALSNIAAGSTAQLGMLMQTPQLVLGILEALSQSSEWDVRKEAAWVVSNVATSGQVAHLSTLVEEGVVEPLCDLLTQGDAKIILVALEALESILKLGVTQGCTTYAQMVQDCAGVDRMENLQEHKNNEVYEKVVSLLETYFGADDQEDENLAPAAVGNAYSFGIPAVIPNHTSKTASGADFAGNGFLQQAPAFDFGAF